MCVFSTVWQRVAFTHLAAANSKARAIENTHGELKRNFLINENVLTKINFHLVYKVTADFPKLIAVISQIRNRWARRLTEDMWSWCAYIVCEEMMMSRRFGIQLSEEFPGTWEFLLSTNSNSESKLNEQPNK